ncbi:hypothetical protein EDM57_04520 [Brevibacillus gelatini]|uniref:Uncharacterized protein n=1 Tax=Brevibacillus gelatini TaxID=1655277 RepID=A0A3M8B7H9_9BACL|nr:hypothetical protein [Brevibacillus gelatini]RNB59411.1 hypothetical protein EDM57_04520 [Brevibacillus gelatini]
MDFKRVIIRPITQTINIGGEVFCVYCLEKARKHVNFAEENDYYCLCDTAKEEQKLREEYAWIYSHLLKTKEDELERFRRKHKNDSQIKELQMQHDLKMLNKKYGIADMSYISYPVFKN